MFEVVIVLNCRRCRHTGRSWRSSEYWLVVIATWRNSQCWTSFDWNSVLPT